MTMKHVFYIIIFFSVCIKSYCQKTVKVTFENQLIVSEASLASVPEHLRSAVLKQLTSVKMLAYMCFENNKVYYESKSQNKQIEQKGVVNGGVLNNEGTISKDLSTSVKSKHSKIIKDSYNNTYTMKNNGKLVTEKLPIVKWKITNKKKNILGYNCTEAVGLYNNSKISIYFTKELKKVASPEKIPFIDGVILEYKDEKSIGKAIKIEKNQPSIKNFL